MQTQFTSNKQDFLEDLDGLVILTPATKGQRFVNLLIDLVPAYLVAYLAAEFIAAPFENNSGVYYSVTGPGVYYYLVYYPVYYAAFIFYFTLMEMLNKGRTIGKLITSTYAIHVDGKPLTWRSAFLRSLCRIVPFEVFSGFGDAPWHDKWTNTTVAMKLK